jgi:hypothetical protein
MELNNSVQLILKMPPFLIRIARKNPTLVKINFLLAPQVRNVFIAHVEEFGFDKLLMKSYYENKVATVIFYFKFIKTNARLKN